MSEFVKHDTGKARFDLIDPDFELALAELLAHGAEKYSDDNWKLASPAEAIPRYRAALRRHENALARGEITDPDSGKPHAICIACNSMFLYWFLSVNPLGCGKIIKYKGTFPGTDRLGY